MVEKHTLRPVQEASVTRMMAEPTRGVLIADDMGVGKTTVASEFIARMGFERVLIIGIKDTYEQWQERLEAQTDGALLLRWINADSVAGKKAYADFLASVPGAYFSGIEYLATQNFRLDQVYNPDGSPEFVKNKVTGQLTEKLKKKKVNLRTYVKMKPLDAIIFDEVHKVQNRVGNAARTLRMIKTAWKIGMSGTPYGNEFEGIWNPCIWVWPDHIDPSFIDWKMEWCESEMVRVKGGKKTEVTTGEKVPGTFVAQLPCYIRNEAAEKAPAAKVVHIDLLPEQRRDYEALEEEGVVYLGQHVLSTTLPVTLRSRLRTATLGVMSMDDNETVYFKDDTLSTKMNATKAILDHWGAQPVAIYCDSKQFVKVVVARMQAAGYNAVEWSGDVSSAGRKKIKRDFLAGEIQYIVAVIQAFSTGLDGFQKVCSKVLWLSQSENGILNEQAIARFFRPGRTLKYGEFQHVMLVARDTHDAGIYSKKLRQRLNMNQTLVIAEAEKARAIAA